MRKKYPKRKVSLQDIADIFVKDHATVNHSFEVVENITLKGDDTLYLAKQEFIDLVKNYDMETLMLECERRDEEKNKKDVNRIHKMNSLEKYNRLYKKVVVKLIRTEEKLPSKKDFTLLEHVLNQ